MDSVGWLVGISPLYPQMVSRQNIQQIVGRYTCVGRYKSSERLTVVRQKDVSR